MPGSLLSLLFIGYPLRRKKNATLLCLKYKGTFARLIKSFVSLVRRRSFPDEPRLSGWLGLVSVLSSGRQCQSRINIMESHPRSHKAGMVLGLFWIEVSYISWGDLGWNGVRIGDAGTLAPLSPRSKQAVQAMLACAVELRVTAYPSHKHCR